MVVAEKQLEEIRDFWEAHPCGSWFINKEFGSKDFFNEYMELRYEKEWHIPALIQFERYQERAVLEVGCGLGVDGLAFANSGAAYTGLDLTQAAVFASESLFKIFGKDGKFVLANAESLPFTSDSFDLVYSHGVLHHIPDFQKAVQEIYRVLKPGGEAKIMVYFKNSFNYYLRILLYMRIRFFLYLVMRPFLKKGKEHPVWGKHYRNFKTVGWKYFLAKNFVHHCTDGPECPTANVYTKREVKGVFRQFSNLRLKVSHLPIREYFPWVPRSIERFLSRRFGFYLYIYGRK